MKSVFIVMIAMMVSTSFAETTLKAPKLGPNEFAVFKDEKYQIVKIKNYKSLELDESCFKSKSTEPSCQAYKMSLQKFNMPANNAKYMNSPAAEYCKAMTGKSFVGVSSTGAESDFCFFGDGSVVKSWSAFYLHFPKRVIK